MIHQPMTFFPGRCNDEGSRQRKLTRRMFGITIPRNTSNMKCHATFLLGLGLPPYTSSNQLEANGRIDPRIPPLTNANTPCEYTTVLLLHVLLPYFASSPLLLLLLKNSVCRCGDCKFSCCSCCCCCCCCCDEDCDVRLDREDNVIFFFNTPTPE